MQSMQEVNGTDKRYPVSLIVIWSLLLLFSALWNIYNVHQDGQEKARIEARTLYELTLVFRRWGAVHGGVYVPVTDSLQPNPYLQVPHRDVKTTGGKDLTLVNPAWMTRMVYELLGKQSKEPIIIHLTSLKYINPTNKPDAWEEQGLRAFEAGQGEITEGVTLNGDPYMRIMKPFKTEEGCLKCHGHQGYKIGDIRGGISIAVPFKPHLESEARERRGILLTHGMLWVIGVAGIFLSTRTLRKKQELIAESEEKYRVLFMDNPSPLWVHDRESFHILTVNDAALRHYGYAREEFLSLTVKDMVHPEDRDSIGQRLAGSERGTALSGVWKLRKKDGSVVFADVVSHELQFAGQQAVLVMAHDITERRKLEEQLRHAMKMDAVGRLAGGVAHDFNNILTAIIGYGTLTLMKMKPDDPLRHNIEESLASAKRGANLTQSLLAFSRKQVINPTAVNINQIIIRIERLLQRLIGEDIKLESKLAASDLIVIADSGQIEQVLMNLATNARDAMPNGGLLSIETREFELDDRFLAAHHYGRPGRYALISLADTGSGMDPKTAEKVFEPFFTTKEMGRGTGLGLSMVYGIIKQNNGYINIYTEVGRGTTFKIYLPLAEQQTVIEQKSPTPVTIKRGVETILVAEDDEPLRHVITTSLKEFGYTVIEAANGNDAVELAGQNKDRIAMLLLDVIMPKKNGKEVYDAVKPVIPNIKVLFMSGYTADIAVKQGILDKGLQFVSKPVSPTDLLIKVRDVLDA